MKKNLFLLLALCLTLTACDGMTDSSSSNQSGNNQVPNRNSPQAPGQQPNGPGPANQDVNRNPPTRG